MTNDKLAPDGSRREYFRSYMKQWRKNNPEADKAQRCRSAASLLRRNGWDVKEPDQAQGGDQQHEQQNDDA